MVFGQGVFVILIQQVVVVFVVVNGGMFYIFYIVKEWIDFVMKKMVKK